MPTHAELVSALHVTAKRKGQELSRAHDLFRLFVKLFQEYLGVGNEVIETRMLDLENLSIDRPVLSTPFFTLGGSGYWYAEIILNVGNSKAAYIVGLRKNESSADFVYQKAKNESFQHAVEGASVNEETMQPFFDEITNELLYKIEAPEVVYTTNQDFFGYNVLGDNLLLMLRDS